jgi:hypothetical protein
MRESFAVLANSKRLLIEDDQSASPPKDGEEEAPPADKERNERAGLNIILVCNEFGNSQ